MPGIVISMPGIGDLSPRNRDLNGPESPLKLAAHVKVTVRNVWVSFSQSYPYADLFTEVHYRLRAPP